MCHDDPNYDRVDGSVGDSMPMVLKDLPFR